ncbi:hypothetical protein ACHAXR_002967 [Thalassiosira sp. AJA248-18]
MTTHSRISQISDFAAELKHADDFDLLLTTAALDLAQTELAHLKQLNKELLKVVGKEEYNRRYREKKKTMGQDTDDCPEDCPDESEPRLCHGESYGTMSKEEFGTLFCIKIKASLGDKEFLFQSDSTAQGISGETRVAVGLRILFGGSYLDAIGRAYDIKSIQTVYNCFHTTIEWIDNAFRFPWELNKLEEISEEFAADSTGCFKGCIGTIDGLVIRIRCSSKVADPSNYFCRKGFYALNVQAICDRRKRILWISPGHQGATHDSTA